MAPSCTSNRRRRVIRPQLPPPIDGIIAKALEKDRSLRYQHASEIRADLQRLKRDTESGHVSEPISGAVAAREVSPAGRRKVWSNALPALAAVLITALIGGYFYHRSRRQSKRLTEKDTIVLADFANSTGDAIFDDTLKTALTVSLRQSPFLNLLADSDVSDLLQQMTHPAGTKLTPELARELCRRAGSKAYVAGSLPVWQPICAGVEGGKLPERKHTGAGADDGGVQGEGAGGIGRSGIEAAR